LIAPKSLFLVAEDDPDDQFMIKDVINDACCQEFDTHFVENGVELINYLNNKDAVARRPNLLMLDLNMPRMDGREALRKIKADPKLAAIPIVILTTSQVEEDVQYCRRFGVAGYFHKPSSIAELREIIGTLCQEYFA
jgi:CheY-like chemotaxis protein